MKNKIEKNQTAEIVKNPDSVEGLITKAIENKVDVDTMKSLLEMRRELKKEWAREQFFEAMSKLQSELPMIKKTKTVLNKDKTVRYKYAPLEVILEQVKELIRKNGFSFIITARHTNEGIPTVEAICKVVHKYGHEEVSSFSVPIDKTSFMNDQQRYASALTYAKRYAFTNAFGILTADEDDDASIASESPENDKEEKTEQKMITLAQKNLILRLIQEGRITEKLENIVNLTADEANNLIKNSLKKTI